MPFTNPFKHHSKQHESDSQVENGTDQRQRQEPRLSHDPSTTTHQSVAQDVKAARASSEDPAPIGEQALPPAYGNQANQSQQPPRYRTLKPDPFDPDGQPYGYQWAENEQNFAHPSSVAKDIGKDMKYQDPKAADLARRASSGGREDLTEMMNYFLRQQELGKKSTDNTIAAWNGV